MQSVNQDEQDHHSTSSAKSENLSSCQIVTFKLGQEEYGVDIMKVQEIILLGSVTQVPEVADFIEGVINLRGNVIPVIDLRKRFKISTTEKTDETRVIVINVNNKTMGVIVDAVSEVLKVLNSEIDQPPETIAGLGKEYLKGLVKLEHRLLILLDIEKILSVEEMKNIGHSK